MENLVSIDKGRQNRFSADQSYSRSMELSLKLWIFHCPKKYKGVKPYPVDKIDGKEEAGSKECRYSLGYSEQIIT